MSIEDNEEIGLFWKPNTQFNQDNNYVLEKSGDNADGKLVDMQENECKQPHASTSEIQEVNESKNDDEKLKHQKSVKFTDSENVWISMLMTAMGTKNAAEVIRWCVRKVQDEHGEEVKKIAKKKEKIGTL